MAGTKIGGLKAAAKNKELHGEDFYAVIGAKGGRNGHTGGFAADRELARRCGRIGGRIGGMKSRRGSKQNARIVVCDRLRSVALRLWTDGQLLRPFLCGYEGFKVAMVSPQ